MFSFFTNIRNRLYDAEIIKPVRSPFPVISIGNISVGGTGKTPCTLMIARMFRDLQIPISLLSSGYKRIGKGIVTIVRNKHLIPTIDPATVGDEVYLHAVSGLYNTVLSCQPKYKGLAEFTTPILIDDGFQHRKIYRDIDIVLINSKDLHDELMPIGRLRESQSSLSRADIIICTDDTPEELIRNYMNEQAVFARVKIHMGTPYSLNKQVDTVLIEKPPIMAVAGIANPERFLQTLLDNGYNVEHTHWFEDHAVYSESDIHLMCHEAKEKEVSIIAITEKDAVKLRDHGNLFHKYDIQLLVIPIQAELIQGKQQVQELLLSICSQYSV